MPRPYARFTLETSSASSISTNATEDNRPGPGRTLGLLYDYLGSRIEGPINRFTTSRRAAPRAVIARTRSRAESSDSSASSIATDATDDNLPGPGRVLGHLFNHFGRKLEGLISRYAIKRGLGPDAAYDRIELRIKADAERIRHEHRQISDYSEEKVALYEFRMRRLVRRLLEQQEMVRDCRRLIKYAQSHVAYNQTVAFRHITSLAINDPAFRDFFNSFGAYEYLLEFEPQLARCDLEHMDTLLSSSRRALVCLSASEVNKLGQRLVEINNYKGYRIGVPEAVNVLNGLARYVDDQDASFIAIRYIIRLKDVASYPISTALLESDLVDVISQQILRKCDSFEWDSVDVLFPMLLTLIIREQQSMKRDHSRRSYRTFSTLSRAILSNIDKTPETLYEMQANLSGSKPLLLEASAYSMEILTAQPQATSPDDFSLCKYLLRVQELSERYPHAGLAPLWSKISRGPFVVLSNIMKMKNGSPYAFVGARLRESLCQDLIVCFASSHQFCQIESIKAIELLVHFSRYFAHSMGNIMEEVLRLSARNRRQFAPISRVLRDARKVRHTYRPQPKCDAVQWNDSRYGPYGRPPRKIYRHRSTDCGRTHVTYIPVSQENPCDTCIALGIWDDWLGSDDTAVQRLEKLVPEDSALEHARMRGDFLLLRGGSDDVHDPAGHIPLLAGVNDSGQREYLSAFLFGESESHFGPFTAVDGESPGTFEVSKHYKHMFFYVPEDPEEPGEGYVIFVLDRNLDSTEAAAEASGGSDATGPFFWRDIDVPV